VEADVVYFDSGGHAGHREREYHGWVEDHSLVAVEIKKPTQMEDRSRRRKNVQNAQDQTRSYAYWLKTPMYVITDGKELLVYRVEEFFRDQLAFHRLVPELPRHWPELQRLLGPEAVLRYCQENRFKVNDSRVTDYTGYLDRILSNSDDASEYVMKRTVSEPDRDPASSVGGCSTGSFEDRCLKHVPHDVLLESGSSVVVLSETGGGKTHLTKVLLRQAARACKVDPSARVPVMLAGQSWRSNSKIEECIYREVEPGLPGLTEQMVREDYNNGRFLLLVDGLDEVPMKRVGTLRDELRRMARTTRTRGIVTCRRYDYRRELSEWLDECEIDPLSRAQIEEYVSCSLSSVEDGDRQCCDQEIGRRFMFNADPDLARLVRNPLLLEMTMAMMKARPGNDVPKRIADLYVSCVGLLLTSWQERLRSSSPKVDQATKEHVLAEYARLTWNRPPDNEAFDEALRRISGIHKTHIVRDVLLKSGLLEDGPSGPAFRHPSFKDYFLALGIFYRRFEGELVRLPGRILRYVPSARRHLERVIAGFDNCDVLLRSRLDPELFCERSSLDVSHMLWLVNGCWFDVKGVNVGYGGTGPRAAHQALKEAGVSEEDAESAYPM